MKSTNIYLWIAALIGGAFLVWGVTADRPYAIFFAAAMFFGLVLVMYRRKKER